MSDITSINGYTTVDGDFTALCAELACVVSRIAERESKCDYNVTASKIRDAVEIGLCKENWV